MSRLRVAILSDAIPGRNGVGTYYDDLVEHLSGRAAAVRLHAPPADDLEAEELGGWRVPMPGDPTQSMHIPSARRIWKEVRALKPHVILAATPGMYGMMALALSLRSHAAFCVAHHTEFAKLAGVYWERRFGSVFKRGISFWDRFMYRRGSFVLVHNSGLADGVMEGGAKEVRLVGTPVAPSFLSTPLADLRPNVHHVVFIGRLAGEKRLETVLEAARELPEKCFLVIGDGPLRKDVERAAQECSNLECMGWVARDEVLEHLDRSDMLVLPSKHETFGSVALEAMIRGRPTLVSPHCGIVKWPTLRQGLFVMDEDESLTKAIRRVASLPYRERAEVAEVGCRAARDLSSETIDHWMDVLVEAASLGEVPL